MLLLTAKAAREIVEAIEASAESFAKAMEANTEALKRIEGKINGQTEIIKGITREAREMKDSTERRQATRHGWHRRMNDEDIRRGCLIAERIDRLDRTNDKLDVLIEGQKKDEHHHWKRRTTT